MSQTNQVPKDSAGSTGKGTILIDLIDRSQSHDVFVYLFFKNLLIRNKFYSFRQFVVLHSHRVLVNFRSIN